MLSILEEKNFYGSFNHNLERNGLLMISLREQAGNIFDLLSDKKTLLQESDFSCISNSKSVQQRCFTVFNISLTEKISREDFISAFETIYTGRKKIWNSYIDRRR